jgi:leucyl-tRNA synthetase
MLEGFGGKELDEAFFDYVLLGKGKPKSKRAEKLRKSFLYWYPLDSRHSGADLVRNHLPFFIFNHVAIFPKEHWPKQIVTNGFVLMEGKKMSKSLANILPLRKAVGEYGADVIRFSVVSGADLTQDTDFNRSVADGTNTRLAFIAELVEKAAEELPGNSLQLFSKGKKIAVEKKHSAKEMKSIDRWLLSRLNRKIRKAHALYEQIKLREVALEIFYDLFNDLHWYLKRTDEPKLKEFFLKWCILINPFMPHVSEEFHSMLGGKGFASAAQFPKADEKLIDEKAEKQEELVKTVLEDVEKIASLVIKDKTQSLKEANIFVAAAWKKKLHGIIRDEKAFDKIMKACSQDAELRTKMNDVQRIAKQLAKNAYSLGEVLSQEEELEALAHAKAFYESEFKCKVSIVKEEEAKDEKAKIALPSKPAIKLVL